MTKPLLLAATALLLPLSAFANGSEPFPGDENFLSDAYAAAEDGTDFSYARVWGEQKAYDGTDTSRFFEQMVQEQQAPAQPVTMVRRETSAITRTQPSPQPVRTVRTTSSRTDYVTRPVQQQRQTLPATKPQPPVVNTVRTVTRPAPQLRGTQGTRTQPSPKPVRATQTPRPQRTSHQPRTTGTPLQGLPNARPGECFARMKTPAQYDQVPRPVETASAYKRAKVQQAVFQSDQQQVMVRDAHTKYVVTPPRFETRQEQLTVKPGYDRLEVVSARFDYVAETIKVSEPRLVWKRGTGLSGISRIDPNTGDTWCLVEEAGETMTLRKRVVAVPEQIKRVRVPAQTVSVPRKVLIAPAAIKEIKVPAEYRGFNVQRLVQPARSDSYNVPAEVDTVMTKVLRAPERFEWVPVLCDTNSGPDTIRSLQTALQQRGLYRGAVDGILGPQTRQSLVAFQRSQGIPHLGYLTVDTVRALGL